MNEKSDAPAEEPEGFHSRLGFVKSRPENNRHYLEQYKHWDWYPVLEYVHDELEKLIPGYNISQIKEKFGGLRYYIEYPTDIPVGENAHYRYLTTVEEVKREVEKKIAYAEAWVAGFEAAKRSLEKN